MVTAAGVFLGLAAIILTGFFASVLARRGRFPELLVLMLLGFLLGPLNTHVFRVEALAEGVAQIPLDAITPVFGALALAIIMFDAGLELRLDELKTNLPRATLHTLGVFALTVVGCAVAARAFLGFPWLVGALLGAALGGVSSAVVMSVARQIRVSPDTRTLLTLECLLVDVFAVSTAVALVEILQGGGLDGPGVARSVLSALAVAIVLGVAIGAAFLFGLTRARGAPNLYILTLGVLLGAYAAIEALGGSGPIGVLALGLLVANVGPLLARRGYKIPDLHDEIGRIHGQASFLVRTFFFVLLGLAFDVDVARHAESVASGTRFLSAIDGTLALLVLGLLALYAALVVPRALVARFTVRDPADRGPAALVVGRGLGAAVLATFPFTTSAFADATSAYHAELAPFEDLFATLTSALVVITVLTTAIAASVYARHWTPVAVEGEEVDARATRAKERAKP